MHEFDDSEGHHIHKVLVGPPYEFKGRLSCAACIEAVRRTRQELVTKYGWTEWPKDINNLLPED